MQIFRHYHGDAFAAALRFTIPEKDPGGATGKASCRRYDQDCIAYGRYSIITLASMAVNVYEDRDNSFSVCPFIILCGLPKCIR